MYRHNPAHAQSRPYSSPPPVYRVYHDPAGPAKLSTTVVHALSDCLDVDVTDGSVTLYDVVDPDALDAIFRPKHDGTPRASGSLSFVVYGHRVTVHADGQILIEPPERYR
ncbi:HalOD1 output domain-containing protein [Natrialbaceae archaeon GCM10025810]|uniref:HalOD1 output domain-containing protein n=1 Tax=Halovalidus salilacus TaxID=3075124 RepID=UPI003616F8FB